jgi:hypothetical protein
MKLNMRTCNEQESEQWKTQSLRITRSKRSYVHLFLFCRSMIATPLLLVQVASASLISSISSSSGVFFEVRSSSIKRLISFAFASLKIPANLINAQTPEHSRVIVDDFINQIGLDHGTTPDVIQQDGSAYWSSGNEGSRVHVAPLELLVRLAGVTRIGFAGVCAGLRLVPVSRRNCFSLSFSDSGLG